MKALNSFKTGIKVSGTALICVVSVITFFIIWEQHQIHIMGALPYLLLLICPLMHLFMHRHFGHHRNGDKQ